MVPSTSFELAESLRQADLLTHAQIIKLASDLLPNLSEDPQELAFALVQRGWLTSFQAEQALLGNARQLELGGFRLLAPLGAGGMGQVYKAWQRRLRRTVALKVIRPELIAHNPAAIRRFKREALAVAQLSHPNVVSIYDADEAEGTHFIVLEYVDGPDLERLVIEGGPLPVDLACDYVRQAALGLQHAHEAGLVHRDIKPGNLLIARPEGTRGGEGTGWSAWGSSFSHGLVKILDMGLARMGSALESKSSMTREGAMMGTPDYVSPEQARDASSVDIRADLYSLGCTFYFLLSGHPPFPDGSMIEKLLKHQQDEPTPIEELRPDLPDSVASVIRRLMAKNPSDRFQTPFELAEVMAKVLGHLAAVPAVEAVAAPSPAVDLRGESGGARTPGSSAPPARTPIPAGRTPSGRSDTPPAPGQHPVTVITAHSLQGTDSDDSLGYDPSLNAHKAAVLRGHKGPVMGLTFSPDGKLLATGGVDARVHIWSLGQPPRDVAILEEARLGDVQVLAFDPGGSYLISGSASLDSRMWKWAWRESLDRDRAPLEGPSFSDALAFSPDGHNLVSAVGPSIWMWTAAEGVPHKRTVLKNPSGDVKALQFSPDSKHLVSGDTGGMVQFWRLRWLGCRPGAALAGHRGSVSCLAYSPDGQFLASAGLDHIVRIWDGGGANSHARAVLQGIKGVVRQMLFLPDPQMLLTACDGGQLILWHWSSGEPRHEWRLEQPIICSLALARDGSFVAAGSTDGTATIYDLVPEGT